MLVVLNDNVYVDLPPLVGALNNHQLPADVRRRFYTAALFPPDSC